MAAAEEILQTMRSLEQHDVRSLTVGQPIAPNRNGIVHVEARDGAGRELTIVILNDEDYREFLRSGK